MKDLVYALHTSLKTLPARISERSVDETAIVEAMDLFSLQDAMDEPGTRVKIARIRMKLAATLAQMIRKQQGVPYERFETGMWSCDKCGSTPVICMVVHENPNQVLLKCCKCTSQSSKVILDDELSELRHTSTPLDPLGKKLVKKGCKRGNKTQSG